VDVAAAAISSVVDKAGVDCSVISASVAVDAEVAGCNGPQWMPTPPHLMLSIGKGYSGQPFERRRKLTKIKLRCCARRLTLREGTLAVGTKCAAIYATVQLHTLLLISILLTCNRRRDW
jgi:hypothetical protein